MTSAPSPNQDPEGLAISLVRGDAFFRLQRAIRLVPPAGLGLVRRAVFFAMVAWLPIALWAALTGHALRATPDESLLFHFGVHVRGLVAIPLLILAEGLGQRLFPTLLPVFVQSGLLHDGERLRVVVQKIARLRDRTIPWVAIAALIFAFTTIASFVHEAHEVIWAHTGELPASPLGFGGVWFLYVMRPIYLTLLLGWLWRLVLLSTLFWHVARLDLDLVPAHPDRAGGLGFLERIPMVFSLMVFAASSVLASNWAHSMVYHDLKAESLRAPAAVFVILSVVICLTPFAFFAPALRAAKRRALREYGALVERHAHATTHAGGQDAAGTVPAAADPGPLADAAALYDAAYRMRSVPVGKRALLAVLLPALLPIIAIIAIQIPIKEQILKLLRALA